MKPVLYAVLGLVAGAGLSSACCFQPSAPDGEYVISSWGNQTRENDVELTVDVPVIRETFTRNGKKYSIEYRATSLTKFGIFGDEAESTKTFE